MFVLQATIAEPRIARVLKVDVAASGTDRTELEISVQAQTIEGPATLNLVFPFSLEGSTTT
jgi:hypothetical protein